MTDPQITVRKHGTRVTLSVELLLLYGQITEEQARQMGWVPPPPVPRLRRWRWAVRWWWSSHRPHLHFGPCDDGGDA